MSSTPTDLDAQRLEAARLAHILLRFASAAAHPPFGHTPPGMLKIGTEAYVFGPSWSPVANAAVEPFLTGLPSPALLSPGLMRGSVHLTLVAELSGERRRWAEKTLSNQIAVLDSLMEQQGLGDSARLLVEFEGEHHVFTLGTFRYYAQHFAVEVGWNLNRLDGDPQADACLKLLRADGKPFSGRSSMMPPGWRRAGDAA